jgi:hypothetical protein
MKRGLCIAGVVFSCGLLAGRARADLVSYTFSGTDAIPGGGPVLGSFSYQSTAPASYVFASETSFGNVQGSLSLTYGGNTYSSSTISATLQPGGLELYSSNYSSGIGLAVILASGNQGTSFTSTTALPASLNTSTLQGSTFSISRFPLPAGPGQAAPQFEALIASGPISSFGVVSPFAEAPEPGTLVLAVLGALGLASRAARRQSQSAA